LPAKLTASHETFFKVEGGGGGEEGERSALLRIAMMIGSYHSMACFASWAVQLHNLLPDE